MPEQTLVDLRLVHNIDARTSVTLHRYMHQSKHNNVFIATSKWQIKSDWSNTTLATQDYKSSLFQRFFLVLYSVVQCSMRFSVILRTSLYMYMHNYVNPLKNSAVKILVCVCVCVRVLVCNYTCTCILDFQLLLQLY